MIRVAVCDDSPEFLQRAVNMVERWSEQSGTPAEIYRFDNGDALLAKKCRHPYGYYLFGYYHAAAKRNRYGKRAEAE